MPETSAKVLAQLNAQKRPMDSLDIFGMYKSGTKVVEKPEILFARLDAKETLEKIEAKLEQPKEEEKPAEEPEYIDIDDFCKVNMKIGKILACEKVEGSSKLLKSTVQIGSETRTIASGIAKWYSPEDMVGKKVVVVTNLPPRKMMGIESCGMLLSAVNNLKDSEDEELHLIMVDNHIPAGAKLY